ncbi:hypothetical protein RRG08_055431 [Elysia crispata]|uniref:Uncharacterized protein n=1 Tax=Elysia crispata TaxID=231223 RepID=A0AAE1AQU5_9GAST|nr:hypothetical protein RRG08_055431 [Elysia crispata]
MYSSARPDTCDFRASVRSSGVGEAGGVFHHEFLLAAKRNVLNRSVILKLIKIQWIIPNRQTLQMIKSNKHSWGCEGQLSLVYHAWS